jgi:hypothetical protein
MIKPVIIPVDMRRILLFVFLIIACLKGFSQTTVKGKLVDTLTDQKIPKALVTIIDYKDSTLIQFTRTNTEGVFEIPNIPNGKYVILISHPMFAGYSDELNVKGEPTLDMGNIQLLSEENLLKELTVLSSDAIKIKGDTIEYTADSFKVKEGATVEDLFKKLPGIQVNKKGEITAQGKRVEKVLVDGDEFFSDDPTVATQNLKAESVDKVQVYEKKDEQSGATDQGVQTINITLKEDAKKGYFGKLKAGGGTNDNASKTYFSNEAMINKFSSKRKASAYLLHNNIGKTGLNWDESRKFGNNTSTGWMDSEGGFTFMSTQSDDEYESFNSKYQGQGIPRTISGGATMDTRWSGKKNHLNASYQFKQIDNDAYSGVNTESYLKDTVFYKTDTTRTNTLNNRHNLNLLYEVQLDSTSDLKWTVKGNYTTNKKDNFYKSFTVNADNDTVNTNNRDVSSVADVTNVNTTLNYFKKFKNPERKLTISGDFTDKITNTDSKLLSVNDIFLANNISLFKNTTDQHKTIDKNEQTLKAGATYKEPISKTSVIEFRYTFNLANQAAKRFTYDDNGDGTYNNRLDSLSSQYVFNYSSQRAGLNYHFKKNKVSFKLGSDLSKQFYTQNDQLKGGTIKRNFVNFFPTSTFVYAFSKMQQIRFNYNGYTTQPAINYIQPFKDNTDPFNIVTGNPSINPSFTNDFNMSYNNNQVLKGRYLFLWANFSTISNDFVSSSSVDAFNRNQTMYVNQNGNMNGSMNANYYIEMKKYDMHADVGANTSYSKNANIINDVKNITQNQTYSANFELGKDIKEWFNSSINYTYAYNISGSSIQQNASINYWTQLIGADVEFVIKKRFVISTDANYNMRQKTAIFTQNTNVLLWNADVELKTFKNRSGVLAFHVNDILNQNLGFQRNASAYSIVQTRYNVLKRYFMLSFTWNFTNDKTKKPTEEDEW